MPQEHNIGAHEYKPTPGSWIYEPADANCLSFNIMTTADEESSDFYRIARTTDGGPQAEANARLIAAAPELLEACRLAVEQNWGQPKGVTVPALDPIRAAIAKAEGGAK